MLLRCSRWLTTLKLDLLFTLMLQPLPLFPQLLLLLLAALLHSQLVEFLLLADFLILLLFPQPPQSLLVGINVLLDRPKIT